MALEEVGVKAVVEGLQSFLGDMGQMEGTLDKLRPKATLLEQAFGWVTDSLASFGREVLNVAEYALGKLLADAVEYAIGLFKDLAKGVLDSADTFQKLQIRLGRLNFNSLRDSGLDYNEAMKQASALTQETLDWTIKLGAITPYDAVDIANIYTLARGYGFGADEAKTLTDAVIEFTAGMGLSNVEMERIIINFGQLNQQGKLNAQDIRDLARGAYVPVNKVLEETAKKLGMTTEEFNKARKAGILGAEAIDAFRQSFVELVGVDFEGASEALGSVFSVAVENIRGLIQDMLGLKVVAPILQTIGTYLQSITDALAEEGRWERFNAAIENIGTSISGIVTELLGLAPSADSIAEAVTQAVEKIAAWINEHREDIVGFFKGVGEVIQQVGQFIKEHIIPALEKFGAWVSENQPLIAEFFKTLWEIVQMVIEKLFGKPAGEGGGGFLDTVKNVMQWVVEHKDQIADWITKIIQLAATWEVVVIIFRIVIGVLISLIGWVASVVGIVLTLITLPGLVSAAWTSLGTVFTIIGTIIAGISLPILLLGVAIVALVLLVALNWDKLKTITQQLAYIFWYYFMMIHDNIVSWISQAVEKVKEWFSNMKENIANKCAEIKNSIDDKFSQIRDSMKDKIEQAKQGISDKFSSIKDSISTKIQDIWNSITTKFSDIKNTMLSKMQDAMNGILSLNWWSIGSNIISGIVNGIWAGASSVIRAMVNVAANALAAAKATLGISSPSMLFMDVGKMTMEGMALGIQKYSGLVQDTMQRAIGQIAAPALSLPAITQSVAAAPVSSTNYSVTNYFNQNIHTSAQVEPIMADFAMMQSLAGA